MTPNSTGLSPQECVRLLIKYRQRWLVPTAICVVLAAGYAMVMPRYWQASQALVVRNEVSVSSQGQPGKFSDVYEMRTLQETILELAKSRQVLAATLQAVEEAETGQPAQEPTLKQVNSLREKLSLLPPYGAEFGKTEVFYLSVKDKKRDRSVRLVDELCQQLDVRMRDLRDEQSQSVVVELEMQVELATSGHHEETAKLKLLETEIGLDLGELRMLHSAFSGQSDLRQQAVGLETEQRTSEAQVRQAEKLLDVLRSAQDSPDALIAMPSSLLNSQPTLRSLKDGLVAAQLRSAHLTGTRTADHPQSQAATKAVERIGNDLHQELQVAIKGVEIELTLNRERTQAINIQLADVQRRLKGLARNRAEYTNRVAAVENSRAMLAQAEKQLSEVRAMQVSARETSLVTPIDRAEVGENPVGIGRAAVMMVGAMGGLILGLGCLFITVPPTPTYLKTEETTAENRVQPERSVRNRAAEESFEYASIESIMSPASATTAGATGVDVFDSSTPIYEVFDQHLAAADNLTTV